MSDQRLGRELGLTGSYAEMPASQIVTRAHDRFMMLRSRFMHLKFGAKDRYVKRRSQWRRIDARMADLALVANVLDGDAVLAAAFSEGLAELGKAIDGLTAPTREC